MGKLLTWVDDRFPLTKMMREHLTEYYAPKNFNFWYYFGSLALLVLVMQIVTGIFLTMYYQPSADRAFESVQFIMRDVDWGWLIRYMHTTGASMFFIVVYMHMFRGLLYGSYKKPRELIWIFGMLIFLALMAEAFMGYLLPWGNMSFWGAQVIISLFSTIPYVGGDLAQWIRGDYVVSGATLNRFFALHVIAMPLILLALIVAHILALHEVGSNNPDGVEIKKNKDERGLPKDGIPFHPYYTVKDLFGVGVFLIVFSLIVFYIPTMGDLFLEAPNFVPADPLATPPHIAPVWYFTPFYSILRSVPSIGGTAFPGVVAMFMSIVLLFFLPWIDRSMVRSTRYRSVWHKVLLIAFAVVFVCLGYLGTQPPTPTAKTVAQCLSVAYFAFFIGLYLLGRFEKTKPVPERVTH